MKNINFWLFAISFLFPVSFPKADTDVEYESLHLISSLSEGDLETYYERKKTLSKYMDIKKVLKFVNGNGDNILHFLVRLEQFNRWEDYQLKSQLKFELEDIFNTLGAWQFLRLAIKKNKKGISPVQEAAFSHYISESPDNRKAKLSEHFSQDTMKVLFGTAGSPTNRGLAYEAMQTVVQNYRWPFRTARDALFLVLPPVAIAGMGASAYTEEPSAAVAAIGIGGGIAALSSCGLIIKRFSDWKQYKKVTTD